MKKKFLILLNFAPIWVPVVVYFISPTNDHWAKVLWPVFSLIPAALVSGVSAFFLIKSKEGSSEGGHRKGRRRLLFLVVPTIFISGIAITVFYMFEDDIRRLPYNSNRSLIQLSDFSYSYKEVFKGQPVLVVRYKMRVPESTVYDLYPSVNHMFSPEFRQKMPAYNLQAVYSKFEPAPKNLYNVQVDFYGKPVVLKKNIEYSIEEHYAPRGVFRKFKTDFADPYEVCVMSHRGERSLTNYLKKFENESSKEFWFVNMGVPEAHYQIEIPPLRQQYQHYIDAQLPKCTLN